MDHKLTFVIELDEELLDRYQGRLVALMDKMLEFCQTNIEDFIVKIVGERP